jgi:hypothetical protein
LGANVASTIYHIFGMTLDMLESKGSTVIFQKLYYVVSATLFLHTRQTIQLYSKKKGGKKIVTEIKWQNE